MRVGCNALQESPALLRELDKMLVRRASAIEDELREISQVRAQIQGALASTANGRARDGAPGAGGASLGQMI